MQLTDKQLKKFSNLLTEHEKQVMEEIASLTPSYGGISFDRLEKESLQWPCPTPEHPGTAILHTELFSRGKGHFVALDYKPPAELPDAEYPLVLTTDRSLFHYHTGTMTRKVKGLNLFLKQAAVGEGEDIEHALTPKRGRLSGVMSGGWRASPKALWRIENRQMGTFKGSATSQECIHSIFGIIALQHALHQQTCPQDQSMLHCIMKN